MTDQLTLDGIANLQLQRGGHSDRENGTCLLEAVAWFAGETHSDHPVCVSPFLARFGIRLNDRLDNESRQLLKQYIPRLVGTAGDGLDEQRRFIALDWAARVGNPRLLDAAGLTELASKLRALPQIVDWNTFNTAARALADVREVTWPMRRDRRKRIQDAVRAELAKQQPGTPADAVADAVAAADADAAAAAAAVADAAAAAAAVAAADADAAADSKPTWGQVYDATYAKVYAQYNDPAADTALAVALRENREDGIRLFGTLIGPASGEEQAA